MSATTRRIQHLTMRDFDDAAAVLRSEAASTLDRAPTTQRGFANSASRADALRRIADLIENIGRE